MLHSAIDSRMIFAITNNTLMMNKDRKSILIALSNTRTISFTFRFANALSQEKLTIACLI